MNPWSFPVKGRVIAPGQLQPAYDFESAGAAHVIQRGDSYIMTYWGIDRNGKNHILRADAPVDSPNDWRAVGGPLIGPQPELDYNFNGPSFPFLLPVTDDYWLLYFCAWGKPAKDRPLPNRTGVAVSEDAGRTWRYVTGEPVIPLDRPYDAAGTGSVWVLHEGGKFRMYYTSLGHFKPKPEGVITGHGNVIPEIGLGYAESRDGIEWTKPVEELLVKPRGFGVEPYEYICSKPCILKTATGYTLWLNTFGSAYRVHRLTSVDGLHWEWAERCGPDGEFGVGEAGAFDSHQRSYPVMVQHGDELRCWYTGNNFGRMGMGYAVSRL